MSGTKQDPEVNHETRLQIVEKDIGSLKDGMGRIEKILSENTEGQKGDRRYVWGVVMWAVIPLSAAFLYHLEREITTRVEPLKDRQESFQRRVDSMQTLLETTSSKTVDLIAQSASSIQERKDLREGMIENRERISKLEATQSHAIATYNARFDELETQTRTMEIVRDMSRAYQERINAITWQLGKFGIEYSVSPWPEASISNRSPLERGTK